MYIVTSQAATVLYSHQEKGRGENAMRRRGYGREKEKCTVWMVLTMAA